MSERPLSDAQFAEHLNKPDEYGASVGFHSRTPITGHGFMTAFSGAEQSTPLPASEKQISDYRAQHAGKTEGMDNAVHGAWKNPATPGTYDQDLSVKITTPREAQNMGVSQQQKASYALPGTRVSRRGHFVGGGGDVLLHTADLGKNDVDPRYRPGALDMPNEKGSFTRNQYQNKDWNKKAGYRVNRETGKKENVSYGDILRKINEGRVERMRGEQ
jgi:hypothetical protein